ncbi:MAG: hypothetical protein U0939_24445 [Pirellulales bacterium]
MLVDLVKTVTEDGLRLDGALHAASAAPQSQLPVDGLICFHGVASNFYGSSLFEALTPSLASLGVPLVWANTRGRDNVYAGTVRGSRRWLGAAFESVDECRMDIGGWITWARRAGWERIGLMGHSLGAIKSIYSQAYEPHPAVTRILALSPPRLCYRNFKDDPSGAAFFEAINLAQQRVEAGQGDEIIRVQYPFPLLITAKGYVEKYGPAERYDIVPLVSRLQRPTFFAYGQVELETGGAAFHGVPEAIRAAARPDQPLELTTIRGADHNYTRCSAPLAEAIRGWLCEA